MVLTAVLLMVQDWEGRADKSALAWKRTSWICGFWLASEVNSL
jgi:hypothetical protein